MASLKAFEKETGLHFTLNHTGKMDGMVSISTSVKENKNCQSRAKVENSICSKCFAAAMINRYPALEKCLSENTRILTSEIIPVEKWPLLNVAFFRFESFGDLNNETQVHNYFNLCKRNPHVRFALWTKNPFFIYAAIKAGNAKPENLIIIASSPMINDVCDAYLKAYPFIDKIFTVYDKETAKTVNINCGARHCLSCLRCYTKTDSVEYVNEILK